MALLLQAVVIGHGRLNPFDPLDQGIDPQPPGLQGLEHLPLAGKLPAAHLPYAVTVDFQRPGRGDGGVQLPERAGRGIAGIGKGRLSPAFPLDIELLELGQFDVDFPPDLEKGGSRHDLSPQRQGNGPHSLEVLGNVLPPAAVPPGGPQGELAILIDQVHGHTVHLGLQDILEPLFPAKKPLQPGLKLPGLPLAEGVFQRQHGLAVGHRLKPVRGPAPHPLGGRIRRDQFGVLLLQLLQLPEEPVIFGIGNLRIVQNIVTVVVIMEQLPEAGGPIGYFRK